MTLIFPRTYEFLSDADVLTNDEALMYRAAAFQLLEDLREIADGRYNYPAEVAQTMIGQSTQRYPALVNRFR